MLAVPVFVALVAMLITAAPAMSASCGKQVVNDWYDNSRVDGIYPLSCYREAIRILPKDVRDYSNAEEEIGRALAYAKQGKKDPGPKPTTATTPPETTPTTPPETTPPGTTPPDTTTTETTPPDTTGTDTTPLTVAGGDVDTSGPSSVPVPLLVLGGLAVLLLAAGSAGYLARRAGGRKGGDGPPPASA